MHRYILSLMVAALMVLGGAAQAQDACSQLGDFPEAGLCNAYCVAMDCDLINDADPLSSPQASEAACKNVAVSFLSLHDGIPRRDVDPVAAMNTLDDEHCTGQCPGGGVPPC